MHSLKADRSSNVAIATVFRNFRAPGDLPLANPEVSLNCYQPGSLTEPARLLKCRRRPVADPYQCRAGVHCLCPSGAYDDERRIANGKAEAGIDSEHNCMASVGITQKIVKKKEELPLILEPFPFPAAHINKKEEICRLNSPFALLLNKDQNTLLNKNYRDVFSGELVKQLIDFQEGDKNESKLLFRGKFDNDRGNSESFNVYLSKLFSKVYEPEGFLIFIEEDSSNYDFENLIKRRGTMFEILIQNNPEPIFIYDTENLGFLEVNNAALNLYGYKKEEFLQMDFTDLYTPEDIQTLLDSSNTPDKLGKFTGPYRHKTKNGTSVFVEISKFEFRFNDKDAHFNIVRDVTQKLELEKNNQLYKSNFWVT